MLVGMRVRSCGLGAARIWAWGGTCGRAEDERHGSGDARRAGRLGRAPRGALPTLYTLWAAAAGPADRGPRRRDRPARPGGAAPGRLPEGRGARPGRAVLRPLPAVARSS